MKRFSSPGEAGAELARRLQEFRGSSETIVIAIVSGGTFVGAELARQLDVPFELLFIRRLLAPFGPQRVLCATSVAGTQVFDDELPRQSVTPGLDHALADGIKQLSEREDFCRARRPPVELSGKQVIVVDNGIHTGSTMLAAIRAVRKLAAKRVVAAVPVADPASRDVIEHAADEMVCLAWPEKFGHVGFWYEKLIRPADDEILTLYLSAEETMNG